MCGAGRLLIPLVARGVKVHGADASPAFLARCEEKLAAQSLATTLFRQDVATLNVPFRYHAAFIAGGAFDTIADARDAAAALARMRAHLVDPGTLLIACEVPSTTKQRLAAPLIEVQTVTLADDSRIVRRSETTWTAETRVVRAQERYTQRRGTQRVAEESETWRGTWYEPADIEALARDAGYREVATEPLPFADGSFALVARA
jgi:cyclopropane fatty-acyl-phospholipid synthase-like methyltransferase